MHVITKRQRPVSPSAGREDAAVATGQTFSPPPAADFSNKINRIDELNAKVIAEKKITLLSIESAGFFLSSE